MQTQSKLTDIPQANLAFQKSLLESEGFVVEVHDQGNDLFTLVVSMDPEQAQSTPGISTDDSDKVTQLIANASSVSKLAQAQDTAKAAWAPFPHNGCAANLSALLAQSGIPVPMTLGAGALAHRLKARGWSQIDVGDQRPGDVGVTLDNTAPPGADHIYLVLDAIDNDEMVIADNQAKMPHRRFASGRGTTPTEYFLRA